MKKMLVMIALLGMAPVAMATDTPITPVVASVELWQNYAVHTEIKNYFKE